MHFCRAGPTQLLLYQDQLSLEETDDSAQGVRACTQYSQYFGLAEHVSSGYYLDLEALWIKSWYWEVYGVNISYV